MLDRVYEAAVVVVENSTHDHGRGYLVPAEELRKLYEALVAREVEVKWEEKGEGEA